MPEGDTLFRTATALRKALEGARVLRASSDVPRLAAALAKRPLEGARIEEVRAAGKNLLVRFEDGRILRTHLRMSGSWHLYRAGEAWQRPARQARFVVEGDRGFLGVCFNAPVVELVRAGALREGHVGRLGPDATADGFDLPEALARLRALEGRTLAEAVLTQSALAGVGNVLKAEALFRCRENPFARVGEVDGERLERVVRECRRLLLRNRTAGPRTTRESLDGQRYWVYGRSGKPCFVCGTTIRMRRVGAQARSTYYCPVCQGVSDSDRDTPPLSPGRAKR